MALIDRIGSGPVAIDTAAFIYFIEEHPRYGPALRPLFEAVDRGVLKAFTSTLTLMETLVGAFRGGDDELAARYETILTTARGLTLVEIDPTLLRAAAQIRAVTGARTPDALQLAAAATSGCTSIVTNDRRLPEIARLRVLLLDALVE